MSFSEEVKLDVWEKAEYADSRNEEKGFRKDQCGAWIKWSDYGNRDSKYGWEIDHITPKDKGGDDKLSNLRPLHWKNNLSKKDGRLVKRVYSKGNINIDSNTGEEFKI